MFNEIVIDETKIEYAQFTYENRNVVYDEVASEQMNIKATHDKYGSLCLIIPTTNGELICHVGDYIIKDPNSKDWCKFMCCNGIVFKNLMKIFGREL